MGIKTGRDTSEVIPLNVIMSLQSFKILKYSKIKENPILSASVYYEIALRNKNNNSLRDLIDRQIIKGKEVGSDSYIYKSDKSFLRTKVLQQDSFLLELTMESCVPIIPQSFIEQNLKEGMVLVSKDSNIGEVAYLEKDYPDHMLSAGINAITIKNMPFYVIAFLKHPFFKVQLNHKVPQGSIIKHAKDLYLDCKIPFPNNRVDETIHFVEEITKAIVRREIAIRNKYAEMSNIYQQELINNCKKSKFNYHFPKYSEIKQSSRLDSGIYEKEYLELIDLIKNYDKGFFTIPLDHIEGGSTPRPRIMGKGNKKWITPVSFNEFGYLADYEPILCKESNITKDCAIIKNRTLKEKLGRHVGTAMFYNFSQFGLAHHSQGCYRIENYLTDELKFIALTLNTILYRKICGFISLGGKMREIRSNQFSSIPFPKFDDKTRHKLIERYDNDLTTGKKVTIKNFQSFDEKNLHNTGILQLASQIVFLKSQLHNILDKIITDEPIYHNIISITMP